GRHILIPGDEVTPQLAAEALRRWCRERFEFTRLPLDSPDGRAAIDRPRPGLDRKRGGGDLHVRAIRATSGAPACPVLTVGAAGTIGFRDTGGETKKSSITSRHGTPDTLDPGVQYRSCAMASRLAWW